MLYNILKILKIIKNSKFIEINHDKVKKCTLVYLYQIKINIIQK